MAEEQKMNMEAADGKQPEGNQANPADAEVSAEELERVAGGNQQIHDTRTARCPFYGNEGHKYEPTGESRPTDAWFYKTEEHYKCACGKGYWSAGFFSITKWDE